MSLSGGTVGALTEDMGVVGAEAAEGLEVVEEVVEAAALAVGERAGVCH